MEQGGGARLGPAPAGKGAVFLRVDSEVVARGGGAARAPFFTRPDTATLRDAVADKRDGTSPYVAGWVAPVDNGHSGQEAGVAATGPFGTKNAQPDLANPDNNARTVSPTTKPHPHSNPTAPT